MELSLKGVVLICLICFCSGEPDCPSVIQCQCIALLEITGVICDNVTDFHHLALKLRDGSLYDFNETYEITLTGVRSFPSRILDGLIVFRLFIDDVRTESLSSDAFQGILRLRRFHVRVSSLQTMPNLSYVSHSLRNLNFDRSQLSNVTTELQNLPLLYELTIRKNILQSVSPNAFLGTSAIKFLDLSNNHLQSLPMDLLDSLPELIKLELSYNQLKTVHGLLKVVKPQFVLLAHNNLTDADDIITVDQANLETVDLSHNPLKTLSVHSFYGKLPSTRFLYLDYCEIKEFNVDHFRTLSNLALLDLTGNRIEKIPNQTLDFGNHLQLVLNDNKISAFEGEITFKMKRFYLNGNRMRFLGSTLQLTQLSEVEVNRNQLEALRSDDLRGMHVTENLSANSNRIQRIDSDVLFALRNDLQNLDLSQNLITNLNGSVRYMSTLKSLNISSNKLTIFGDAEFIGLNELSELFMQNNQILALGGQLQRIPQLLYLVIQHNNITTLTIDQLPKSLRFLYFKDNLLKCDCRLMPFLEYLDQSGSTLETDASYCDDALPTVSFDLCPWPCTCYCTQDVNSSFIGVDCHGRNLSWTPAIFLDQSNSSFMTFNHAVIVAQNKNPKFQVADRTLALNLEDNSLNSLSSWRMPYDLKKLKLARNSLTTLPKAIEKLKWIRILTLSENPWSCNCDAIWLKGWMTSKMDGILDFNKTRCGPTWENVELTGKLMNSLSDVDLCPTYVGLYVSITFGILISLLVLASATIAYHHYEMNIKVWLYAHGVSWVKQNDLDKDKTFDAFISYSHEDQEFVHGKLVAGLEERVPDLRLCLHDRHFLPGEFIHTNIMNAVNSSKRTVLVLTKEFLESEWCLLEFRAAHLKAMEDKVARIIVIKVGNLPEEDIDPAISVYLKSTTYLEWSEKYFWQKLIYTIPEPTPKPDFEKHQVVDSKLVDLKGF